jgi:alcohol dehydrogenase class IV
LTCPADLTAASGMDCFTQLTEAFISTKSNIYTDALAMEGLKFIKTCLMQSYKNGQDYEAREGMSFAALTSGICLANAGLGVVHGFASSIGGRYNIPHGVICGTLMAISNEINVRKLRMEQSNPAALKKYALLGELFLEKMGKSDTYYTDGFIDYLHYLTNELGLQGLKKYGVTENDLEAVCNSTECKNNPVRLEIEDLMEILTRRFI